MDANAVKSRIEELRNVYDVQFIIRSFAVEEIEQNISLGSGSNRYGVRFAQTDRVTQSVLSRWVAIDILWPPLFISIKWEQGRVLFTQTGSVLRESCVGAGW